GADGLVQLLDAETLQERALLRYDNYPGWLISVAFSPDGKTVAGAGATSGFLWNTATGERRANFQATSSQASFAFSADGKTLFTSSRAGIKLIEVATGKE